MPRKHHLIGALLVAIGVAAAIIFFPRRPPSEPPPVLGAVADFELTDQTGKAFSSARELRGRVWAASFIFTRCTTVCPVLTGRVKTVEENTRAESDVRFVSFSVDPEHDTPAVLAEYARARGADTRRWSFLTGDVAPIAAAMKIGLDRVPDAPPPEAIIHGSHIVLIDRAMRIRGYYDSSDPEAFKRLYADIPRISNER